MISAEAVETQQVAARANAIVAAPESGRQLPHCNIVPDNQTSRMPRPLGFPFETHEPTTFCGGIPKDSSVYGRNSLPPPASIGPDARRGLRRPNATDPLLMR